MPKNLIVQERPKRNVTAAVHTGQNTTRWLRANVFMCQSGRRECTIKAEIYYFEATNSFYFLYILSAIFAM